MSATSCSIAWDERGRCDYARLLVSLCACGRRIMQIEPGLEQLKRCFAWIFFLTCVLNVAVMIGMRVYISTYTSMLAAVEAAGDRQVLAQVCVTL